MTPPNQCEPRFFSFCQSLRFRFSLPLVLLSPSQRGSLNHLFLRPPPLPAVCLGPGFSAPNKARSISLPCPRPPSIQHNLFKVKADSAFRPPSSQNLS